MFKSLSGHNYRLWFAGVFVSNIGTWVQRVAQDWLVLTVLTDHNGTAVGITTALQFLPILFLGPYAGLLADRLPKRRLLLVTQTALGFFALLLGLLVVTSTVELWHVYGIVLGFGIVSAVDAPSRQAFVSEVVGEEDLRNAVALNSASFNFARLAAPGAAGLLIAWAGTGPLFLLNAASFVAVIVALLKLRGEDLHPGRPAAREKGMVREGFRYVGRRPDLMMVFVLVGIVSALALNFQITSAMMATSEFGLGAGEFGLLGSIMAVGTLSAALLAASQRKALLRYVIGGAVGVGFFLLVSSVMPTFVLYAVSVVPIGLMSLTFLNSCNTTVQLTVDPVLRGRVLALYMAVQQGSLALGAPLIGWIGTEYGARWALALGGGAALAAGSCALVFHFRRSDLRARDYLALRRRPALNR